jgi:peptidoglycan/LPS O-acetylase OafA/YrhL
MEVVQLPEPANSSEKSVSEKTTEKSSNAIIRSDIQFMRALSVIFIVCFHLDFYSFRGGFVGVDIFFVCCPVSILLVLNE